MQTFFPYPDVEKSVKSLDNKRLGKQRVEARQILNALEGKSKGWINHPATRMWRGHEAALAYYHNICIQEWLVRGYKNTMELIPDANWNNPPTWFGNEEFHRSHRSNLKRKDPIYYSQFEEPTDLPYVWPV